MSGTFPGWKEHHEDYTADVAAVALPLFADSPVESCKVNCAAEAAQPEQAEPRGALQDLEGLGGLLGDGMYDSLLRDSSGGTGDTRVQEVVSCGFGWDPCNNAATATAEAAAAAAAAAAAGAPDMLIVQAMLRRSVGGACGEGTLAGAGRYSVGSASSGGLFEGWLGGGREATSRQSTPCPGAVVENAAAAGALMFEAVLGRSVEGGGAEEEEHGDDSVRESPEGSAACVDVHVEDVLAATPSSSSDGGAVAPPAPRAPPDEVMHACAAADSSPVGGSPGDPGAASVGALPGEGGADPHEVGADAVITALAPDQSHEGVAIHHF